MVDSTEQKVEEVSNVVVFDAFENARVNKCISKGIETKRRRIIIRKVEPQEEKPNKKNKTKTHKQMILEAVDQEKNYMLSNMATIIDHHMMKTYHELGLMDFEIDTDTFSKDFQFAGEALAAAILRTLKEKHPLHDFVDHNFTVGEDDKGDKTVKPKTKPSANTTPG